jgi:EAL domain-containing protein (putative c-di-GMP-specific phosphodiesterase class I)
VHALKIDRVFVQGLGTSSCDLAIVKSIIGLGSELGLDVVAEGIETLDQRALLYQLGCEKGQGYFFGGPAPAEELFG